MVADVQVTRMIVAGPEVRHGRYMDMHSVVNL